MFAPLSLSRLVNHRTVRISQYLQLLNFIGVDKSLIKTLRQKHTFQFRTAHFFLCVTNGAAKSKRKAYLTFLPSRATLRVRKNHEVFGCIFGCCGQKCRFDLLKKMIQNSPAK
jgi:hypothetical protein